MNLRLDHLVISATDLADGAARIEKLLGVPLAPGGRHAAMGTHNRLLSLGPALYLEVIAIDPDAPPPGRPRWYDLDRFDGATRLTNWAIACDDIDRAVAGFPAGTGTPMDVVRGDLSWQMAVPDDGCLPFDGISPALIRWRDTQGPAGSLPDHGVRLKSLTLRHPRAGELAALLPALPAVTVEPGVRGLHAVIDTPNGPVNLP